ncbi:hypothetical protein ACFQ4C_29880 [Larkinella insperata]|uniref:Uncharacterized protein n=1 Tax=Larkinella insperata TaxID=332158 RepID=A0ABW3QC61_9BACT
MSNFNAESEEEEEMAYVINIADGSSREFYISTDGKAVPLDAPSGADPQFHKTTALAEKQRARLMKLYPVSCNIYVLERRDFEYRREILKKPR